MTMVSYDTGDMDVQWRCQLFATFRYPTPTLLLILTGYPVFAMASKVSLLSILRTEAIILIAVLLCFGFSVFTRSRKPRLCKTTITEYGVRDVTPSSSNMYSWAQVSSIEMFRGDIYFFVSKVGCVFVPRSAFSNEEDARQFYKDSQNLKASR